MFKEQRRTLLSRCSLLYRRWSNNRKRGIAMPTGDLWAFVGHIYGTSLS